MARRKAPLVERSVESFAYLRTDQAYRWEVQATYRDGAGETESVGFIEAHPTAAGVWYAVKPGQKRDNTIHYSRAAAAHALVEG